MTITTNTASPTRSCAGAFSGHMTAAQAESSPSLTFIRRDTSHNRLIDSSGFVGLASWATSVRRYLPACRPATVCVQTSARCPQRLDLSDICEVTVTVLMLQPDAENNISIELSKM